MNAVEFIFAVAAVSSATGIIYAWNRFVYNLDDRYGTHTGLQTYDKAETEQVLTK